MKKQLFNIFAIIALGSFVLFGCEADDHEVKTDNEKEKTEIGDKNLEAKSNSMYDNRTLIPPAGK